MELADNVGCVFSHKGKPVGTPDAGTHFRILQEHNVAAMFVAPSAIRAIRKEVGRHLFHYSVSRRYKPHGTLGHLVFRLLGPNASATARVISRQ